MANPTISVLMPVHNSADYLGEAVASIVHQDFEDWELLAVDDGSTDSSPEILQYFAAKDGRIRVFRSEHQGIVKALRLGCACARGRFIARMDADDIALPQRFSLQMEYMASMPEFTLCGGRIQYRGGVATSGRQRYELWINSLTSHESIVKDLFVECPLPHPTFMIPRAFFNTLGGYRDQAWPEDYDLVMRAWRAGATFIKPDPILLLWRDHANRLSMISPKYAPEAFRRLKRYFLFETYLHQHQGVFYQWGAGEVGKVWLREWPKLPVAVVDINPRKIGRTIHGVSVISPESLPPPGTCFIVVAVGAPGARDEIRDWMNSRNYYETRDYLFIA